jgi:putative membrane protein insertion efficiency factor
MTPSDASTIGTSLERGARTCVIALIDVYRLALSPLTLGLFGTACRFEPSCSRYAREALVEHGLRRGLSLAARRLLRCHPLGGFGHDPVPARAPAASE